MKIKDKAVTIRGTKGNIIIRRMEGGIPHIRAQHEHDLYYGLGYMQGHDRQVQLWLTKLIGLGIASENLEGSDELIEIDKYMRWMDFAGDAKEEEKNFSAGVKEILKAYCKGVNDAVAQSKRPFEFRLVGYRPDKWTPADVILIGKLIGFIGLTQSQGEMEKFIIHMIQKGVDTKKIKELIPYMKENISKELINIIKKVKINNPIIPNSVPWFGFLPNFSASNNWAVSPKKTASKAAIMASDPHLEINRLPSIWYEAALTLRKPSNNPVGKRPEDFFMIGATVPGTPFMAFGRSNNLAWSATYAFMDVIDYFIEDVKDKKYRRGKSFVPFVVRQETIKPKKKDPIVVKYYENEHGVLDGEPDEDGYYLTYAWSARRGSIAETMDNIIKVPTAKTTGEAMKYFANLPFAAFNWVMADTKGNIGFQMSGRFPKKAPKTSGILPYLGWDKSQDWKGFVDTNKLPKVMNPKEGYIITANEDLNHLGKVDVQNLPMAPYRANRIKEHLEKGKDMSVDDMKPIHFDTYSTQARIFMEIIGPLLPKSKNGKILKNWDFRYDVKSRGATLFESIYEELLKIVFGENGLGPEVVDYALAETPVFNAFFGNFDRILLSKNSSWFGKSSRDEIYKMAIKRGLKKKATPYGKGRKVLMANMFFGGKLPKFLGFDYGPIELQGCRATIPQGQIFKFGGRVTTFAPSYRLLTDMSEKAVYTNIPGGPSDRRFSKYYKTGIEEWEKGIYKTLKP